MSRRVRAIAFTLSALAAAVLGAALADRYGSSVARGFGPLRPVVVLAGELRAGRPIGPRQLVDALELRRVPQRFVPPGALAAPGEALGLEPVSTLPAGSYLLAAQLRAPRPRGRGRPRLGGGRRPVELSVSGADALLAAGRRDGRRRVDVVVTTEPGGAGPGRTYVAAAAAPLLGLRPGDDGPGGLSAATLGLTRGQALRLIAAQSFARQVTLLPEG